MPPMEVASPHKKAEQGRRDKMVYNINKMKGKITENGYNMKTLSKELGMCEITLRRKINNKSEITIAESLKIKDILNLTDKEYTELFFNK